MTRSAGAVELWAKTDIETTTESKAEALTDTSADRGIEKLIRDYLLMNEAKGNATILA
jgi:hypothetical protein